MVPQKPETAPEDVIKRHIDAKTRFKSVERALDSLSSARPESAFLPLRDILIWFRVHGIPPRHS